MSDKTPLRLFEWSRLQFVPNPEQGVAANFGYVLTEVDTKGRKFIDVILTSDWRLVRLLDPSGELDYFYELANRFRAQMRGSHTICSSGGVEMTDSEWLGHIIQDSFSNSIRMSKIRVLMAKDVEAAVKILSKMLFKLPAAVPDREAAGVHLIKRTINNAFAYHGIGKELLIRNFKIAKYVQSADPSPMHYMYEVDPRLAVEPAGIPPEFRSVFRFLQAVSLKNGIDGARTLGYAWPEIREGIREKENTFGHLTAVIEESLPPDHKHLEFAKRHFAEHGIVLRHLYQVDDLARTARTELQL